MNRRICLRPVAAPTKPALGLIAAIAVTGIPAPGAWAEDRDAQTILKAMSDYVGRQESLSLKYNADVEVLTPAVEKFSSAPPVTSL
jgi:hypothetical protein